MARRANQRCHSDAVIIEVGERTAHYAGVLRLSKTAKQTVGFLPDSAFAQRARQGTLLAALEGEVVVGYALFDLPRQDIRLVHLVVDPAVRGTGHARALVDAIVERFRVRRGIRLSCRNDYPASSFWPRVGFVPVGERHGRSLNGQPLTLWWRSFHHTDLLSLLYEEDDRPTAVLDSCTFFDVVSAQAPDYVEQLSADWLSDHVRLGVTGEVLVEISRGKDSNERARQRTAAHGMLVPEVDDSSLDVILGELHAAHPDAPSSDEGDLRQIARAVASAATWLVTTDAAIRTRYAESASRIGGLRIVRPEQLLRDVDEVARSDSYRPVELARTSVTCREVDHATLDGLAARFVNHSEGERIRDLRAILRALAGRPKDASLQVVEVDGTPRALLCTEREGEVARVLVARVAGGRGEMVLARHLLAKVRADALAGAATIVHVVDQRLSRQLRSQLSDEGFVPAETGHVAVSVASSGTLGALRMWLNGLDLPSPVDLSGLASGAEPDRVAAALAEAMFRPYRIVDAGLPTFVVPIQHRWAVELFDSGLAAAQLFQRQWDLGLRRELVYYRSPRNARGLTAPARVLWYVSGSSHDPGARAIRAVSLLDEVVVATPSVLHQRFERLGVYSRADVEAKAVHGRAMALRFSHTELLAVPVTLTAYRQLVTNSGGPAPVLRSPEPISESLFLEIVA
jgi:ribosomal protein S18 acetylase RimI-like enzyme